MRAPKPPNTPIDDARMRCWVARFRFYRTSPSQAEITAWLELFSNGDRDLAARILDCVEVTSEPEIHRGYKEALERIPGWSPEENRREGRWFFLGFGKAGESGQSMIRLFREANKLTARQYDPLFCTSVDLPSKRLTADDTVVFVDDFSGTGIQASREWDILQELIGADAKCYLVLTAATEAAIEKLRATTPLEPLVRAVIETGENIFSDRSTRFTGEETQRLLTYCRRADGKNPKGFGKCGLLHVLSHKTPNNSIPILHANHPKWSGLFPRYI